MSGEEYTSSATKQMAKIQTTIKETLQTQNKGRITLKQYSDVNKKLSNGLEVSLNVIVDLSKILRTYHVFLDEIQGLLVSMGSMYDEDNQSIQDLKNLTDVAIEKLNKSFAQHLDDITLSYKNNNMETTQLDNLRSFLSDNTPDSKKSNVDDDQSKFTF
jgi:hypothetical protein